MKEFIKKIIYFNFLTLIVITACYYTKDYILNKQNDNKSIYIWGDSQSYRGIDTELFASLCGCRVTSASAQGSGVYDFLIFTEKVPRNSKVIISLSKLMQIRHKDFDRNLSGISPGALFQLYENNYSPLELFNIFVRNIRPKTIFNSNLHLFTGTRDNISQLVPHYQKIFSTVPSHLTDKQTLFLQGISTLKEKNCKLTFVEFPYHPQLREIELNSPLYKQTEGFKDTVLGLFGSVQSNEKQIVSTEPCMYDFTHLNQRGARLLTKHLVEHLTVNDRTHINIYSIPAY